MQEEKWGFGLPRFLLQFSSVKLSYLWSAIPYGGAAYVSITSLQGYWILKWLPKIALCIFREFLEISPINISTLSKDLMICVFVYLGDGQKKKRKKNLNSECVTIQPNAPVFRLDLMLLL